MRLLHSIHSVNRAGGGPIEGIFQLAAIHKQNGHSVEIVSLDAPDAPWVRQSPLPVHAQGPGKFNYGYSPRLVPWLRAHAGDYDAIIVNGIWQFSSFGVWQARLSRTPYFVFTHGMLDPWFKRQYPLKHLKKWLYWPWAEYRVLRDAQSVLFTCEEERRLARESFWLYRCRETVVNYGTQEPPGDAPAQIAEFYRQFPQLRQRRCWLFLGRIHPKKGCDLLLQAFAQVAPSQPDLHLAIAGPDQTGWQAELARLAAQLGIADRVSWLGMLTGNLKWGALRAAEAFVLPSHQENFGIAVVEAMACGTPVLISRAVNIYREIEDDGAGLADDDDLAGTLRLLQRWQQTPPDEQARMRQRAKASFARRFEAHQAAARLIDLIHTHKPNQP